MFFKFVNLQRARLYKKQTFHLQVLYKLRQMQKFYHIVYMPPVDMLNIRFRTGGKIFNNMTGWKGSQEKVSSLVKENATQLRFSKLHLNESQY